MSFQLLDGDEKGKFDNLKQTARVPDQVPRPTHRVAKTCRTCQPVGAIFSGQCYFLGKARKQQAKTRENRRKQAKNRRFFGANFFGGKIGRC